MPYNNGHPTVRRSYMENEDNDLWNTETAQAVSALGAQEEDICWVTPVLDEHFTYFASVLAGTCQTLGLARIGLSSQPVQLSVVLSGPLSALLVCRACKVMVLLAQ
jgi:hypothetical protein